jgi:hypothetical protein
MGKIQRGTFLFFDTSHPQRASQPPLLIGKDLVNGKDSSERDHRQGGARRQRALGKLDRRLWRRLVWDLFLFYSAMLDGRQRSIGWMDGELLLLLSVEALESFLCVIDGIILEQRLVNRSVENDRQDLLEGLDPSVSPSERKEGGGRRRRRSDLRNFCSSEVMWK